MRLVGRMSEMYKSGGYNIYQEKSKCVSKSIRSASFFPVVERADELYGEVRNTHTSCRKPVRN